MIRITMFCDEIDLKARRKKTLIKKDTVPSTSHVIQLDLENGELTPNSVCLPIVSHKTSGDYEPYLVEINFKDSALDTNQNFIVIANNQIWEDKYTHHMSIPTYMTENPGPIIFAVYRTNPAAMVRIGGIFEEDGHLIVDTLKDDDDTYTAIVNNDTEHIEIYAASEDFTDFITDNAPRVDIAMDSVTHIGITNTIENFVDDDNVFDTTDIIKCRTLTLS